MLPYGIGRSENPIHHDATGNLIALQERAVEQGSVLIELGPASKTD